MTKIYSPILWAFTASIWIAASSIGLSKDPKELGLVEFESAREIEFSGGFEVLGSDEHGGEVIKTILGPASANIKGYKERGGERLYISDWSFSRLVSDGISPNWIRAINPLPKEEMVGKAQGKSKMAFVVGVGAYKHAPVLGNATNDALLISRSLEEIGFSVHGGGPLLNPDSKSLADAFSNFSSKLNQESEVVVYFAGHGLQIGGENLLLPADFGVRGETSEEQVRNAFNDALRLSSATEVLSQADVVASVLFLDCCRDPGFFKEGAGMVTDGTFAKSQSKASNLLIVFAAKHGQVAFDGSGSNSPFAEALADEITIPGLSLRSALNGVTRRVLHRTEKKQQPFIYGSLDREVYLAGVPVGFDSGSTGQIVGKPKTVSELLKKLELGKTRSDIQNILGKPGRSTGIDYYSALAPRMFDYESYETDDYALQMIYERGSEPDIAKLVALVIHSKGPVIPFYVKSHLETLVVLGKTPVKEVWGKPDKTTQVGFGIKGWGTIVGENYTGSSGNYSNLLISADVIGLNGKFDPEQKIRSVALCSHGVLFELVSGYVGSPFEIEDRN